MVMALGMNLGGMAQSEENGSRIGLYTMSVGNSGRLKITVVSDGHLLVKPVQAEFAQRVDSAEVTRVLEDNYVPSNEVDLAMNILLLEYGDRRVLIDAGAGEVFGDGCGRLAKNLAYAGVSPKEITDIVLTHAHPDHIGGLTDGNGKPVYPNAEVYLAREEYRFWMSPHPDFSKSTMTDTAHMRMLVRVAQTNLKAVEGRLHLLEDGETLFGCLQVTQTPGHTPGHVAVRIFSDGEELHHIADVVHSEIISFKHPDWIYNSDTDWEVATATREKVLNQLADTKSLVFAYHLPWSGLGHVKHDGKVYKWIPRRVVMPY